MSKPAQKYLSRIPLVALFITGLGVNIPVFAQTSTADTESPLTESVTPPVVLQVTAAFTQQQLVLNQVLEQLDDQSATPAQLASWRLQNAGVLALQEQREKLLAAYSAFQRLDLVTDVEIPDGATPTMEDFLVANADLANRFALIHNQLAQQATSITTATSNAITETENALFRQQNRAALAAQDQRAKALADESAHQPLEFPPALAFPPGMNPLRKAFLLAQDQYERDEIATHNAYCGGDLAALNAAMDQFHRQSSGRLQQIQQMAQDLAPTP